MDLEKYFILEQYGCLETICEQSCVSFLLCVTFKYYVARMLNRLPESAGVLKSLTHVKDSYPPKMRYLLASLSAYMHAK